MYFMRRAEFKTYLSFIFIIYLFVSCNLESNQNLLEEAHSEKLFPFREISPDELDIFIPEGYAINANDVRLTESFNPMYINLDKDLDNEIFLILEQLEYAEGKNAIVSLLKFDSLSNNWFLLSSVTLDRERVSKEFRTTDLDNDSINEIHLMTNSIGLNYYDGTPIILELNHESELINLFPQSKPTEISYVFDDITGNYFNINYIWAEGEVHWGCHYFKVEIYTFSKNTYTLKETKVTSTRYGLDPSDSILGGCNPYNIKTILEELKLN